MSVWTLIVGVTAFLAVATLLAAVVRAELHRQRIAELGVAAALGWCVLVSVPLPRIAFPASVEMVTTGPLVSAPQPEQPSVQPEEPSPRATAVAHLVPEPEAPPVRTTTTVPTERGWSLIDVLRACFWAAAACAVAYLALGGAIVVRTLLAARAASAELQAELAEASHGLLVRVPRLLVSAQRGQPFCLGLGRGVVVVPVALTAPEARERLRVVLRHEAAHLARGDGRGRLLFALALPLLALHPLFWWLRARAHFAAEVLADEVAASTTGRALYVREMIELAARTPDRATPWLVAIPAFRSRSEFFRRMQMLMQRNGRLATSCSSFQRFTQAALTATLVALPAAFFGTPSLRAQEPTDTRNETRMLQKELQDLRQALTAAREQLEELKRAERAKVENLTNREPLAKRKDPALTIQTISENELVELKQAEAKQAIERTQREAAENRLATANKERYLAEVANRLGARADGSKNPDVRASLDTVQATATPTRWRETSNSELVSMLNSKIDLQAELEVATYRYERAEKLKANGNVSDDEVVVARSRVVATKKKLGLVENALSAERRTIEREMARVKAEIEGTKPEYRAEAASVLDRLEQKLQLFR